MDALTTGWVRTDVSLQSGIRVLHVSDCEKYFLFSRVAHPAAAVNTNAQKHIRPAPSAGRMSRNNVAIDSR
jgi:hypothetical protein